ncbi:hypothetical protein BDV59DRAFT_182263 [Aspergillus ambiguus]|uniref:uncharacterized protein n=1 Tax=Aspergillus ambiguus TaxID=176160 RepID=UPI003CCD97A6
MRLACTLVPSSDGAVRALAARRLSVRAGSPPRCLIFALPSTESRSLLSVDRDNVHAEQNFTSRRDLVEHIHISDTEL